MCYNSLMIYLDSASTEKLLPSVKAAMIEAMDEDFGNASSLHSAGTLAKLKLESSREKIAHLIGADPEEIIFTSGGTESNNTIIHVFKDKDISASAIEHPSILKAAEKYARHLELIPVNEMGIIELRSLKTSDLYSVMLANNELGTLEPIEELRQKLPKTTFLHSDLTQALGKIPIDVKQLDLDYATISAHKIGGPIGIGALYVKKGSPFSPLLFGGHQENNLRAGTCPVVQIIGFAAAADFIEKNQTYEIYNQRVRKFRNSLAKKIQTTIPSSILNTPLEASLPHILNISFPAAEGESIQLYLDLKGNIQVSTGSACASGDGYPSHVIMATKHDAEIAHGSIRFSLGLDTTEKDIEEVMHYLPDIIKKLRSISTINPKERK